jgi:hypothetical protein
MPHMISNEHESLSLDLELDLASRYLHYFEVNAMFTFTVGHIMQLYTATTDETSQA